MEGDWNFEGSNDGVNWMILHAARSDNSLNLMISGRNGKTLFRSELKRSGIVESEDYTEEERAVAMLHFVEKKFRHTWELNPPPTAFYQYFRIIGADIEGCLHGEGLEIYGDVFEE